MTRNAHMGSADNTVWNGVWVGCEGAPTSHCGNQGGGPNTTVASSPSVLEKPYIVFMNNRYYLMRPKHEQNKVGITANWQNADAIDFANVYVAKHTDTAAEINTILRERDVVAVVFQPGIYHLEESIQPRRNGTVLLGLGMATLIPTNGNAAIEVGNLADVRIAGLLLEAGTQHSEKLLRFGSTVGWQPSSPGSINDVFVRTGRFYSSSAEVSADTMIEVNMNDTVIDNVWLWRGDHDKFGLVKNSMNPTYTGLEINGDNVVGYSLACEHTLGDMLVWNGNNGRAYFYQSEFPYDVNQQNYGDKGYAAYKIGENVSIHHGYGVGAYTYFRDNAVTVNSGIKTSGHGGVHFTNSLSVFLNGNGQCNHVIDNAGATSRNGQTPNWVCDYYGGQSLSEEQMFLQ